MVQQFLSTNSPYSYVRHDNSGQGVPANSNDVTAKLSIDGLNIHVADNAIVTEPIILLNSAANKNTAINTITIGKNAQVQIIEYLMCDDSNSNNNVTTDIHCSVGVQLNHCILQHASNNPGITQQATTKIFQAAASHVNSNVFSFGGTSKIELAIALQGADATCQASCLAFTNETESQAILLKIDHEHQSCTSKSIVRGVLKDKSSTDFIGRITVHPNAKKSIADLQIKNLLCSPKAQAVNKPELEIYNDDVRCSHGSSTGQLDENALFYMRSRGIDEQEATAMLLAGFIQPVIDSCKIDKIAKYVHSIIAER